MALRISDLPIKTNLLLLAAISVLGFAIIGATIAFQAKVNAEAQSARLAAAQRGAEFQTFDDALSDAKRFQRDFVIRRDFSIAGRTSTTVRQARSAVQSLANGADASLAPGFGELGTLLERYGRSFDELVSTMRRLGLNENEGQQGKMRGAIHDAETALNKLGLDKIVVSVLQLRRNEKDFQLRETNAPVEAHGREMAKLKDLLTAADLPAQQRADLVALAQAYATSFGEVATTINARNAKIAELDGVIRSMDPIVAQLHEGERGVAAAANERISAELDSVAGLLWTTIVVTLLAVVGASLLIGRSIARPITEITRQMQRLGQGETDIAVEANGRNEIAEMGRSLLIFRDNLVAQRRLEADSVAARQAQVERARRIAELTTEFQAGVVDILDATARAAGELESTARSLTQISSTARELSINAAAGANEASTNVQTVASAADELTASIREISRQVSASSESAGRTTSLAADSEARVRELNEVALRIGDVVKLINSIASQTNLLALNATIEAARAGDAGRGFAVVANEVKALAAQTAKATEEIGAQITAIQERTSGVVGAMSEIGGAIRGISEMTASVASAIEEQTAATHEIGRNVEQAAAGVEETNRAISGVRNASEETGMASGGVLDASTQVAAHAEALGKRVRTFLEAVRAA
ncbi:MAG: methyl-accepting chemotaxis protein [Proteobacteria bacterium]|nr:methyl-accepting chemotaxis protein [Pseudomonadota bacterium]